MESHRAHLVALRFMIMGRILEDGLIDLYAATLVMGVTASDVGRKDCDGVDWIDLKELYGVKIVEEG